MNSANMLLLKAAIYEMGLFFNQPPTDERITAYAKALQNYTPVQVKHAFNQVILSGSAFFPSLAEILKHLRPAEVSSEDIGNFVANEVIQKVKDFGSWRLREAMDALSDVSKAVIKNNTALLAEVANSDQDSLQTIRAQIRNLARAVSESHKVDKKNEKLESIGINTGRVLNFPEFRTMDFSGFLPNGTENT